MADEYAGYSGGFSAPYEDAAAVTPSDAADLANTTRALYVGGAGDVKVDMAGAGAGITFTAVPAGTLLNVRATRVYLTDTTATAIVALW